MGEGETEEAFLKHVKALYAPRGCGLQVTVRCARGKGAAHVVDVAIRQSRTVDYDTVAALLDTDTDWNAEVARLAAHHRIHVLRSQPMFEAMMLRAVRRPSEGTAEELKRRFAPLVNGDGLDSGNYGAHFGDEALRAARRTEAALDRLLRLLRQ